MSVLSDLIAEADRAEDPALAEQAWKRAYDRFPRNSRVLLGYGDALIQNGDLVSAVALLEPSLAWIDEPARAHALLGEARFALGQPEKAILHFETVANLLPESAVDQNNLCVGYLELERLQDALAAGKRAVSLDPEYADARLNLGVCYGQLGCFPEAVAEFQECTQIDPANANAFYQLGLAQSERGDWLGAEQPLRHALRLAPELANVRELLITALANLRRWEEAGRVCGERRSSQPPEVARPETEAVCLPLNRIPMQPPLAPADLAYWLPVDLCSDGIDACLAWQFCGLSHLDDPFFRFTERRLAREYPDYPLLRTKLDILDAFADAPNQLAPSAFVFHIGRCGSTLLSNAFRSIRGAVSLSEPSPVHALLQPYFSYLVGASYTEEEWLRALPRLFAGCIAAFGSARAGTESRLFIKFTTWPILHLDLIHALWPTVPKVFLYRDPQEVLASYISTPIEWVQTRSAPVVFSNVPERDKQKMSNEEYTARLLGLYCEAAAQQSGRLLLLNYNDLSVETNRVETIHSLFRAFGVGDEEVDWSALAGRMIVNAKDPDRSARFVPDGESKRQSLSRHAREMVSKFAQPAYRELERLRQTIGHAG